MNKIRTSLAPLDPGRNSFRLCSRDPAIRFVAFSTPNVIGAIHGA
jgi:hypothetical protein